MLALLRSRGAKARIRRSWHPGSVALEGRLAPATLAGWASLPSAYSAGAPVVNDQGIGYVSYSLPYGGTGGNIGGIAKILPDGSIDANFATFPIYSAGSTYLGVPYPGLVGDPSDGDFELFGTTTDGGSNRDGSVFTVNASGAITTIASFDNAKSGSGPDSLLLSDGMLYGTTYGGGPSNDGGIFSLPVGGGTPKVVVAFNGTDGDLPNAGLTISNGILYGTTQYGGTYSSGIVFSVPAGGGDITPLASFPAGTIANGPVVIQDGFVMGTTAQDSDSSGDGSLFRVPTSPGGQLYRVPIGSGSNVGSNPIGGLIDDNGTIVGETATGGSDGTGSIFEVNVPSFTMTTLAVFPHHGTAGVLPHNTITSDAHGNVCGVAHGYEGVSNYQAIFWKLSDLASGGGGGGPANLTAPRLSPPAHGTILETTTPRFKWTHVRGATSYELLLTDFTPGIADVLSHPVDEVVTGRAFTLPDSYTLNPGHYYRRR